MAEPPTLVLASGNPGKLRELQSMLQPLGWRVHAQSEWAIPEAVENGLSFIENALIKARHAARLCGMAALGDDSGLAVDALHGAPGIYSARYAGEGAGDVANNQKLLADLHEVPEGNRSAHFYCAMAYVRHAADPAPLVTVARWDGRILAAARGQGGFGYDPLFWLAEQQCTAAELPLTDKNRLSHRGQALAAMVEALRRESTP